MKNYMFLALLFLSPAALAATAVIEWEAPTTYVEGEALDPATEILSYTIYYGTQSGEYSQSVVVAADKREATISNLTGTWYFVATSTSTELEESDFSNEVTRRFTKGKPKSLTIRFRPRMVNP
jgi:hypothetical protein